MKKNPIRERTFGFALMIIKLYKQLIEKKEYVISKQILKSGTSVGANVEEAQAGSSKKDFIAKMTIACKESRETKFWLELLKQSQLVEIDVEEELKEINEILSIIYKIVKTSQENLEHQ